MAATYEEMVQATKAAIGARNQARDALGKKLMEIADDCIRTCGVDHVAAGEYRISWETVRAHCSQWSNEEGALREEVHTLIDRRWSLGAVPDLGYFDGHNMQHQHGPTRSESGNRVTPAPVRVLREIAAALPAVVAALHQQRQAAMAEQTSGAQEALATL